MLKTYDLACNIDIMCQPRITLSKGRYSTSDKKTQRVLDRYPGVTLISTGPDEPPKRNPDIACAPIPQTVVTNGGLQIKEKRPSESSRVAD
jgi:hypothetical protein